MGENYLDANHVGREGEGVPSDAAPLDDTSRGGKTVVDEHPLPVNSPVPVAGVGPKRVKKEKKTLYFFKDEAEMEEWKSRYYSDDRVIFCMLPYLQGRETALISASGRYAAARHMKCHSIIFFKSNMNAYDHNNKDYMIYYSIAGYYGHPTFSFSSVERQRQQREWTDGIRNSAGELIGPPQMMKYIVSYDLFFDFDNSGKIYKDIRRSEAWRDCKVLSDDFDKWGVRYRICFSGSGFHLIVPYDQFKSVAGSLSDIDFIATGNVYNFCMRVRERIVNMLGLGSVDLTVVDAARLAKCPFSMSKYGTVAIPCETKAHFDHFDINSCHPQRVLGRTDLYMKGISFTNAGTPTGFLHYLEKRLKKW